MSTTARWLNRQEWAIRLLHLSTPSTRQTSQGLVLIQIDGLSERQLEVELQRGTMPFLSRLLQREQYTLHTLYSGLPANTPGFQGELFYGIKSSVPAFSFRDHETGRLFVMYTASAADAIEQRLRAEHTPLLEGGSAYTDIFTGGAAEAHFCVTSLTWRQLREAGHLIQHLLLLLLHPDVVARIVMLSLIELVLAVIEAVRGILRGKETLAELHFILTRIGPVILLRELVVLGACLDAARGLPVIHVNFVGYDDHAHRRGPHSRFARWPLVGIDQAIARIWRAAHRSRRRDYDVWVYSDHGQVRSVPYPHTAGRSLRDAVQAVCHDVLASDAVLPALDDAGDHEYRYWPIWDTPAPPTAQPGSQAAAEAARIVVAAMGSIGHIYPARPLEARVLEDMARRLVDTGVPLVLAAGPPGEVTAWTSEGTFRLPEDGARILGDDHPFLAEAAQDLIAICRHPSAGALVLLGWRAGGQSMSFPVEHGSHAGFAPEETRAFALLTMDAPLGGEERPYLRPMHLREAALRVLGRSASIRPARRRKPAKAIRVMTYNIHRCIGLDGRIAPERIARVIARHEPDLIAIQEVDVGLARTHHTHQAEWLAEALAMSHRYFAPAISWTEGHYGNAVLSCYPLRVVQEKRLPQLGNWRQIEPRGALWVEVQFEEYVLQVISCHLSIWPYERWLQTRKLMGPDWVGRARQQGPVILCGDFNATPGSPAYQTLTRSLRDAQMSLQAHRSQQTFSSRYPISRVDHVFLSPQLQVDAIKVPRTVLAQVASDHLPLVVDLHITT